MEGIRLDVCICVDTWWILLFMTCLLFEICLYLIIFCQVLFCFLPRFLVPYFPWHDILKLLKVGHLGEDYEEWVHQPIVSKEGPRFFESDFWEVLLLDSSRVHDDFHHILLICDCSWTVLDAKWLVGNSPSLAPCCFLVALKFCSFGSYNTWSSIDDSVWHFYLDFARIYSSSLPFPY